MEMSATDYSVEGDVTLVCIGPECYLQPESAAITSDKVLL